jgi:hypothetical protein
MSSSCLETRVHSAIRAGALAAATGLLCSPAALAAEVFYQPIVSVAATENTNVELTSTGQRRAEGYLADAATMIGIATPTSQTTLMPRLLYNYYPKEKDLDRLEGFVNLNSRWNWQRSRLSVLGLFDHRLDLNAQTPTADYNPVNPGINGNPNTSGRIATNATRNYLILQPTYNYNLTPLSSLGVGLE